MRSAHPFATRLRRLLLSVLFCLLGASPLNAQTVPKPSPEVHTLLDKGKSEEQKYQTAEAVRLYEQALQTARDRKDRAGEAAALVALGYVLLLNQPPKSLTYYEQALPLYQEIGDRRGEALCVMNQGHLAYLMAQPQKGLAHFEKSLAMFRELGDKAGQAGTLSGIGSIYRSIGQPRTALEHFQTALALYQETGYKKGILRVLINLGGTHAELSDFARAQERFEEGLKLARELDDKQNEAILLGSLGTLQTQTGSPQAALQYYEKSLALHELTGNRSSAALCYNNMVEPYVQTGNLLKALESAHRALSLYQAVNNPRGVARALLNLASFQADIGQPQEAEKSFRQALQKSQETGDIVNEIFILNNLGNLYGQKGQSQQERECYEKALELNRKETDRYLEAFTLRNVSEARMRAGEAKQALAACEKARNLFQEMGYVIDEAAAALQLCRLYVWQKQFPQAVRACEQALQLYRTIGDVSGEAEALARLGDTAESQGHLAEAQRHYAGALTLREAARASLGGLTDAKSSYLAERFPLYQHYIRLLLQAGQNAEAFQWTQKAKARVLIDLMETGNLPIGQHKTEEDRQKEERLQRRDKTLAGQWFAVLGELSAVKRQAQPDKKRLAEIETQMQTIRRQQQQLERDWRVFREDLYLRNPQLARQRSARTVTLTEVAETLPPDTALLEYAVLTTPNQRGLRSLATSRSGGTAGQEEIVLFVVTQQEGKPRLFVYRTKTPAGSLARLAQNLREACASRPDNGAVIPYQSLARHLYRLLISPAESALAGKRRLILCPDGPLWDVPFQVLLMEDGRRKTVEGRKKRKSYSLPSTPYSLYLWERFDLVYAYSATGLKAAQDVRQRPNRARAKQSLLVLANPNFGVRMASRSLDSGPTDKTSENALGRVLYERAGGLSGLPHTREEARAILAAFPDARVKMEEEAQETLVKQTGGDYRYLHFATHAVFNNAAPLLSGIVLAQPAKDSTEDGILTVRELFDLALSADMMVLSACETARGAKRSGEGIIGLSWAMFVAGVPTQLVSQWSVDDAATAQLMGGFYRRLKQGKGKEAALRASALALLRDPKHSHPFYWAPFIVMGDWR